MRYPCHDPQFGVPRRLALCVLPDRNKIEGAGQPVEACGRGLKFSPEPVVPHFRARPGLAESKLTALRPPALNSFEPDGISLLLRIKATISAFAVAPNAPGWSSGMAVLT